MSSIFLSHSHADKPFVRRLAADLRRAGARVWVDDAEIQVGDSLIEKIRRGIDDMEYVGAVLSPSSVTSKWVQRELDVAMNQEIAGKRVKVLPIVLRDCDMPGFLVGKLYADFRSEGGYEAALALLLKRLGIELKPPPTDARSLFTLLSAAIASREDDLTRKAIVGFLSLPEGNNRGLVRDVAGSIAGWAAERSENQTVIELCCQVVVDTFVALEDGAVAAVEYFLNIPDYFRPPPKVLARGVASPHAAVRIACNLMLYGYPAGYGDSDDALAIAPDRGQPLALRVAAIHTLGLAAHVDAARMLNQLAASCEDDPAEIHAALVRASDTLGRASAPSQVLDAFQSIMTNASVAIDTRRQAARRFLEVEQTLHEDTRAKYDTGRRVALSLQDGSKIGQLTPMSDTPTQSSVPDVPSLSREAQTLLKEAVEDPKGRVVRILGLDGLSIQTNRTQFVEKNNPRASAIWESALQELETARLIADKGYQREVFGVTKKGYEVGDLLNR